MRKRSVLLPVLGLFLLALAAAGGLVWWKISGLKQQLIVGLESALHAKVQVASLDLDLPKGEVHAAGISLANQRPDAPWDTAEIDQATAHFHFMDLLATTLPLQVNVSGWKINLHAPAETPTASGTSPQTVSSSEEAGGRVHVTALTANGGEVSYLSGNQPITVHSVAFHASTHGGPDWSTDLQCSAIAAGTLKTGPGSVRLHSDDRKITFTDLALHCGDGLLAGNGDLALSGAHPIHGTFQATSIPVVMLVSTRWQMILSGLVSGNLTYHSDDVSATAEGAVSVSGGHLNALPWLGKATTLVGLPDIAGVELDRATADFSWKDHVLSLKKIDLRKNEVLRIAGELDVAANGDCDGHLKLGLPSTVTTRWPRLQTDIFSVPFENYNWAAVHVTGPADHLQEDLSPRLLAAGVEQGSDLIQQTSQKASDVLNQLLK